MSTTAMGFSMGAASAQAQTPSPMGNTLEIHVINHYTAPVRVYAEDAFGRVRTIGWVNRAANKTLTVPADMRKHGAVRIKVYSDAPVWSPRDRVDGVWTMPSDLKPPDSVGC